MMQENLVEHPVRCGLVAIAGAVVALGGCTMTPYGGEGAVATGTVILNKSVPLETEHNQVIHIRKKVRDTEHDFKVLFGPYPPGERNVGRGQFVNPDPQWHTIGGFSVAWGWWPILVTNRVRAITEGTTVIVQAGESFDRVFLIDPQTNTNVRVEDAGNSGNFKNMTTQAYIQADGSAGSITLSDPTAIPTSGEICEFVKYVLELAGQAGADVPEWECNAAAGDAPGN
jgi:hypothetical protein